MLLQRIFNKIKNIFKVDRKESDDMARFICARVMIAFLEDGEEGARLKYKAYFSKKAIKRYKEATDALIKKEPEIAFIVTEQEAAEQPGK